MTAIPDEVDLPEDVLEFKPEFMAKLYDIGFQIGLDGPANWRKTPARLGRFEQKAVQLGPQLSEFAIASKSNQFQDMVVVPQQRVFSWLDTSYPRFESACPTPCL